MERELSGLQMQLKLSTGPKKSALMMMRKKIELQNERVLGARDRQRAAKKVGKHTRTHIRLACMQRMTCHTATCSPQAWLGDSCMRAAEKTWKGHEGIQSNRTPHEIGKVMSR